MTGNSRSFSSPPSCSLGENLLLHTGADISPGSLLQGPCSWYPIPALLGDLSPSRPTVSRLQGTDSTGYPSNQHHTQHTMKYHNIHPVDEDFIREHSEADEQHTVIVNMGKPVNRIGK